jgi:hypothetical protein
MVGATIFIVVFLLVPLGFAIHCIERSKRTDRCWAGKCGEDNPPGARFCRRCGRLMAGCHVPIVTEMRSAPLVDPISERADG